MATEPTTPVRVPKAISTYKPTTQDPDLRSEINTVLLRDGHISKIQETLLHALHASPTNWPSLIQDHALSLLRSGTCTTFPALINRVLDDIKNDTIAQRSAEGISNGASGSNSSKNGPGNGTSKHAAGEGKGRGENGQSLALPKNVVEEGLRVTRECLDLVCEVAE